ncbi:MAG: signal peptidase I, partial [Roseburia sp.]|nr:signal peptidase I [Roseburia sp.]
MFKKIGEEPVENNLEEIMPEPSQAKRIANTVINVILVIAIILAAVCTYVSFVSTSGNGVPSIFGIRVFSIQTKSMYPTLEPGDLIFDSAVKDSSELEIGDIITYWTVIDGQRVLNTHRIVQIYDGGGYLIFETQGDNNTIADALTVHESEIVGKYNGKKLGGVGKVFDYLQTSTGFLLVVVVPVAIFFLYHLIQFFRVLFEYNNIKNKLLYEQERGRTEDLVEDEKKKMEEARKNERERLERELREKLKTEILAANGVPVPAVVAAEVPAAEEQVSAV